MRIWKVSLAVSMALIASQAQAGENWVKFATDAAGRSYAIDANSIRKGIDGLVYFSDSTDDGNTYFEAAVDCLRHVRYIIGGSEGNVPDWRNYGSPLKAGSVAEGEAKLICAKVGSGPLRGKWVGIGFGQSIDKDSIRRGSDALVYFTDYDDTFHHPDTNAADCQRRLIYFGQDAGWRDRGRPVGPNSFAEAELNYVCANVR